MASTKKACTNGDKVVHTFEVCNTGTATCYLGEAILTVPAGLQLNYRPEMNSQGPATPAYDSGIWNNVELKWIIGELKGGDKKAITFEFEVIDETIFEDNDFIVELEVSTSCIEDTTDNIDYLCITKFCPQEDSGEYECVKPNAILK